MGHGDDVSAPVFPVAGSVAPVPCRCGLPLTVGGDPCGRCGVAFGYIAEPDGVCGVCASVSVFRFVSTCAYLGHHPRTR